jgi:uncharacterized membrane protein YphA (DoxX/SURF4 family)
MEILQYLFNGLPHQQDSALLLNRLVVGTFFFLSGYAKLFHKERHATLVTTLRDRKIPFLEFNQWFVPLVEFFGGLAVISGILAPLAAIGMVTILLVAIVTDGPARIKIYSPVDGPDYLCDFLYLPEPLYVVMLMAVIICGPGKYSLHILFAI